MKLLLLASFVFLSGRILGQEYLDVNRFASCELFAEKKDYDAHQRIEEINKLENKEVTVFVVKGKDYKISSSYTGIVKIEPSGDLNEKSNATVLVVETDLGNGQKRAYLPLTNYKAYRIYLTECIKGK